MLRKVPSPLPWLAGLLAVYLIAPLVAGIEAAAATQWSAVDYATLARACVVSLASASTATLLTALCGIPLGFALARKPGRTLGLLGFLVQLPLALPPLASGVLLLFLLGYNSPLGRLTHGALTDSFAGIVLAEAFVSAPFVIIAARSAFAAMDPAIEDVAATLGRRRLAVFWRATLPAVRPALLAGLLLAWLRAFGEFGATVMVAYHPYSLPVYTYVEFGDRGLPAMLPVLLPAIALALAIMALSSTVSARTAARPIRPPRPPSSRTWPQRTADPARAVAGPLQFEITKRVNEFDLTVAWSSHARRLAILGPSGSGKSLTLRLIAGLEQPDRALIRLGTRELTPLEPSARRIGYVPQSYALFPHLDVAGQLRFPAGADPVRAERWLERLELTELARRRPKELSLGQQQRVALARALVRPTELLLLDEPFSALDAPLRAALRGELCALQAQLPVVTLIVTHDPQEALQLADELLLLASGRPLQCGPAALVLRRPVNELAARLLGADNVAAGVAAANRLTLGRGTVLEVPGPPLPAGPVGWSVPPERIWVHAGGAHTATVEALIPGAVPQAWIRFADARIRAACRADLAPGQPCRFDLDTERLQIWPHRDGPAGPAER
jgi:ABC-type sulfate/molybdate transport systems ATPase subunit/ABC-type sulfate transport system permease component